MNKTTKIRVKTIKTPADYKSLSKNDEEKLLEKKDLSADLIWLFI